MRDGMGYSQCCTTTPTSPASFFVGGWSRSSGSLLCARLRLVSFEEPIPR